MWIRKILIVVSVSLFIAYYLSFFLKYSKSENIKTTPNVTHTVDWAPKKEAIDNWENTAPFIHCPHGSNRRVELFAKLNSLASSNTSSFCSCPTDVTFLLVTNMAADVFPVSEQLYQLCGCRYVHIRLDRTVWPSWQWSYKVSLVAQAN